MLLFYKMNSREHKRFILCKLWIYILQSLSNPFLRSDFLLSFRIMQPTFSIREHWRKVKNKWIIFFENALRDLVFSRCKDKTTLFFLFFCLLQLHPFQYFQEGPRKNHRPQFDIFAQDHSQYIEFHQLLFGYLLLVCYLILL